jgi:hypothetical protein
MIKEERQFILDNIDWKTVRNGLILLNSYLILEIKHDIYNIHLLDVLLVKVTEVNDYGIDVNIYGSKNYFYNTAKGIYRKLRIQTSFRHDEIKTYRKLMDKDYPDFINWKWLCRWFKNELNCEKVNPEDRSNSILPCLIPSLRRIV